MQRRRVEYVQSSFEQRLTDAAARLRKDAQGTPAGIAREQLILLALQAENASQLSQWLRSPVCNRNVEDRGN
jgi:hypothetical protein